MSNDKTPEKNSEHIATLGSPSTTTSLFLEILDSAADKKLVGSLIWFEFEQEQTKHYALGQITEVELRNFMLETAQIRSLVRQRGSINLVSGVQDTHMGMTSIGAVFKFSNRSYVPSILGTVPSTGTPIYLANENILTKILARYQSKMFYLGRFYESGLKLPLWFRHFGHPRQGGAGEAYHIGIYGMTGSGKSTLAKAIMMAYARHPQMAIFVFDPSGEFKMSGIGRKSPSDRLFVNIQRFAKAFGKKIISKSVAELVFDQWDLFEELLYESNFFKSLTVPEKGKNHRTACRILRESLESSRYGGCVELSDIHKLKSYKQALKILGDKFVQQQIYASQPTRDRFAEAVANPPLDLFKKDWKPVAGLFNTARKERVSDLLDKAFDLRQKNRPIVIIDLSEEGNLSNMFWNSEIRAILIHRIVKEIKKKGEDAYKANKFLNTLVVLDEAHRLVPQKEFEMKKQDGLRAALIDAVQTTRKYGIGWMFISLSLSTLHKDIYHENRISFYGFGLNSGSELSTLKELILDQNSLRLYQSFRDPHAVEPRHRTYSFMSKGPVSPLSFSGSPLFLTTFDTFDEFFHQNNISE